MDNLHNIRGPKSKTRELFRTPRYAFEPLLDFDLNWFSGDIIDPCAGDGRMVSLAVQKGLRGNHLVGDIAPEEAYRWGADPYLRNVEQFIGCYFNDYTRPRQFCALITNPPFTKAQQLVEKAKRHVRGPICVLQSVAWMGTQSRSRWLSKQSGLAYILNLARRPQWEFDDGQRGASNIWDFAWYVFFSGHTAPPQVGWLFDRESDDKHIRKELFARA